MSQLQIIGRFVKPLVNDVAELVTHPNKALDAKIAEKLSGSVKMVNVSKLSDDIHMLIGESLNSLTRYKDCLSEELYSKLENAVMSRNFKLKDIIVTHYSKLEECKTLADVSKFYPEIKIPNITPKSNLTSMISDFISASKLKELQELAINGKADKIDEFLESIISPQLKNTEKYSNIKPLLAEVKESILSGDFSPKGSLYPPKPIGSGNGLNTIASLYGDNFDEVVLEMLKRHYLKGENASSIVVESAKGIKLTTMLLQKQGFKFPTLDKYLRQTVDSIEAKATKLIASNITSRDQLVSKAYRKAWNAGRLKNEWRAMAKHWKILENVWMKNNGIMKGCYDTDKLIDSYLLNKYISGVRDVANSNPFAKYMDSLPMDNKKKHALEMLYSLARPKVMSGKAGIIDTVAFQEFKAKFDIEAMTKSIEDLEQHYQKAFLKKFWAYPGRKETFATALRDEYKKIDRDFELTDDLLKQAANEMIN